MNGLWWVEAGSTVLLLLFVIFAAKGRVIAWPLGILGSALALIIYWEARLYIDFGLYIFYVLLGFYGWYEWGIDRQGQPERPVSRLGMTEGWLLLLAGLVFLGVMGWLFSNHTDADLPWWDAFTTGFGLIATWMQARKRLENWLLWLVVDSVAAGVYLYKELYFFSGLYLVYLVLAVWGYREWRIKWQAQQEIN